MSYEIFIIKFKNDDIDFIPFEELNSILKKYGKIIEWNSGLVFVSSVGEMCDNASIMGDSKDSIFGISFDRPTLHNLLPELIYDLLAIDNTCFFGTDMEYVQSRSDMATHLSGAMRDNLEIIKSSRESWPLI